MKHISTITTRPEQPKPEQTLHLDEASARVVGILFRELKAIFPAWRQAWPTADDEATARRCWIKAFADAGLRDIEAIRGGIAKSRRSGRPFMPSVGEFIQWCGGDGIIDGLDENQAFLQSLIDPRFGAQRHPAVIHALRLMPDAYAYQQMRSHEARKEWSVYWRKTCDHVTSGGVFAAPEKALEQKHTPADKTTAEAAISAMRGRLGGKNEAQ